MTPAAPAERLTIKVAGRKFGARLETGRSPLSVARFRSLLPLKTRIIHARWSGEACWIPFGELDLAVPWEDPTSYPAPGQLLLHPGGVSETEILLPYGSCRFASKAGQLAGNHFATIDEGLDQLADLGRLVLWEGAQDLIIEAL